MILVIVDENNVDGKVFVADGTTLGAVRKKLLSEDASLSIRVLGSDNVMDHMPLRRGSVISITKKGREGSLGD